MQRADYQHTLFNKLPAAPHENVCVSFTTDPVSTGVMELQTHAEREPINLVIFQGPDNCDDRKNIEGS